MGRVCVLPVTSGRWGRLESAGQTVQSCGVSITMPSPRVVHPLQSTVPQVVSKYLLSEHTGMSEHMASARAWTHPGLAHSERST